MSPKARISLARWVLSALFLALGLVLPFLTGQIPAIGSMLLPMHLPVLLCGFVCGWPYGLAVGFVCPLLRHLLFAMPPMPTALSMAVELAAYGCISGWLYHRLPRKVPMIYLSLLTAMVGGRILWGLSQLVLWGVTGNPFGWAAFFSGAVTGAIPGIVAQIVLIPLLVMALQKARLMPEDRLASVPAGA